MKACGVCRKRNVCVKICSQVEARLPKDYTGRDPKKEVCLDSSALESFAEKYSYESWDMSERSSGLKAPDLSLLTDKERNALLLIA